jgi:PTS system mannose-specific IIC component
VSALFLDAIPVAILGAVLGLDMVSFPQVMISRPIVSATVGGAFVGRPLAGLLVGAVLEFVALETLPFGASRYAEWGTAGVVGGVVMAAQPAAAAGSLALGVSAALATAVASSWSMVAVRKLNGRMVRAALPDVEAGSSAAVNRVQLGGLTLDLIRGFLVTLVAVLLFVPLSQYVNALWHTDPVHSRAVVVALASIVAAGALWKLFHATTYTGWLFLTGLVIGGATLMLQ